MTTDPTNYDPTNNDQPAPNGIFGLSSPGRVIAITVVLVAFGSLLLAGWIGGQL